ADSERWIANNIRRYEEDGHGLYVIEERETGAFLGNCGPVRQLVDGASEVELGWHVKRDRWSQGIASEAATACSDHARRDLGLGRLISLILPANMASRRVAEKIGMTVEKETVWGPKAQPHLVYSLRMD
ncbi:MAG: hypothetical protein QOH26_1162, partial [Actinomycetota bacterium]|nr:hypothetical protein [Actinomycetota bacterium]